MITQANNHLEELRRSLALAGRWTSAGQPATDQPWSISGHQLGLIVNPELSGVSSTTDSCSLLSSTWSYLPALSREIPASCLSLIARVWWTLVCCEAFNNQASLINDGCIFTPSCVACQRNYPRTLFNTEFVFNVLQTEGKGWIHTGRHYWSNQASD